MTWKDQLTWANVENSQRKKAKFRDALFFVSSSDRSIGRRNIVHQYPFKDDPFIEDLGKDVSEFTITGYVIQNPDNQFDYFAERDALINALEEEGAGTLVDPFLGTKQVNLLGKAQVSETFSPGGIARFTMTFVLVKDFTVSLIESDSDFVGLVDDAKSDSEGYIKDGFDAIYEAEDAPDFSTDTIQDTIDKFNSALKSVTVAVQSAGPAQVSKALAILSEQYLDIDISTIRDSCEMINGIIGMFNGLLSLSGQYGDIVVSQLFGSCSGVLRGLSSGPFSGAETELPKTGFMASTISEPALVDENLGTTIVNSTLTLTTFGDDLEPIDITTVSRAQEAANRELTINSIRSNAVLVAGSTAIRTNHSSYDSANNMMNDIIDALDAHLLKLGNDVANDDYSTFGISISNPDEYTALESFRAVFVNSMISVGADLAKIIQYEVPPTTVSSLQLAYKLYENLDREQEIILRNIPLIKNPGFLPQAEELEILNE